MKHITEVEVFPVLEKNPLEWFDFVCQVVHLAPLIMKAVIFNDMV